MDNTPAPIAPSTPTPAWLSHIIKVLLVAVPVVLAIWHPNGAFKTADAQGLIVAIGLIAAFGVHVVEIILHNIHAYGLSMEALEDTFTEEEAYFGSSGEELDAALKEVKTVLAAFPAFSAALALISTEVDALKAIIDPPAKPPIPAPPVTVLAGSASMAAGV